MCVILPSRTGRLLGAALAAVGCCVAAIRVQFDPRDPRIGPFPSDALTIPDAAQRTGLRMNLPLPDCVLEPSTCSERALINELDGFQLQPRLTVRFSGPVNPDTLRDGVFYVWLDPLFRNEYGLGPAGKVTPINQVAYDPSTLTAYAKPDEYFDQTRRYAVVVTSGVRDLAGAPVEADPAFRACVESPGSNPHCNGLASAMCVLSRALAPKQIVAASVFTTMTVSHFLESVRLALYSTPLSYRPTGAPAVFDVLALRGMVWRQHLGGDQFGNLNVPLPEAGRVAFGSFQSPRFINGEGVIPAMPTAASAELPVTSEEIFFHVWLPSEPPPPQGYPVLLAGHANNDSRFGAVPVASVAPRFLRHGFAVVAVNAVGSGFGPKGELVLTHSNGQTSTLTAPGRAIDVDGDGAFARSEGCNLLLPGVAPIGNRDCFRQTVIDYVQLVRHIRSGLDLDGNGLPDLDGSRISYLGQSMGGRYGTILHAVEPEISSAVINVGSKSGIELFFTSLPFRGTAIGYLRGRVPNLLNRESDFVDQYPLRYEPVRILTEAGAAAIQETREILEWLETSGASDSYAMHLKSSTLSGVPIKRTLFQVAWGDMIAVNPSSSALIRSANLREASSMYRHDLARSSFPDLPQDPLYPHLFLTTTASYPGRNVTAAERMIAEAAQEQALLFLTGAGESVPDVNHLVYAMFGANLFETPQHLPEALNFR